MNPFLNKIFTLTMTSLLVLLTVGGLYLVLPKFAQMRQLERQRDDLKRKIEYKSHEVESLKIKQQRFAYDPDFVEFIARQTKRVKRNEVLFLYEPAGAQ